MKKLFAILLLACVAFPAFSIDWKDYLLHFNISAGPSFALGGNVSGDSSLYVITIYEPGWGGASTSVPFKPSDIDRWPVGIDINVRIPAYYNDTLAAGLWLNGDIFGSMVFGLAGGYFEYYLNKKISFLGGFGCSLVFMSKKLGATPGSFTPAPNKSVDILAVSKAGFGFMAGVKYHFLKWGFLEAGYSLSSKHKTDSFNVRVDGEVIERSMSINPLFTDMKHGFSIKIGFGI